MTVRYDFRKRRSPEAERLHLLRPGNELIHDHSEYDTPFSIWLRSKESEDRKFLPEVHGKPKHKTYRIWVRDCPRRGPTLQALNAARNWPKQGPRYATEFNLVKWAFKYFAEEPFERNGVILFPSFKEDPEFGDAMLGALLAAPGAPEWVEIARELGIRFNKDSEANGLLWKLMMFDEVARDHPRDEQPLAREAREVVRRTVLADRRFRYGITKCDALKEALDKSINAVQEKPRNVRPPRLNYASEQRRSRLDKLNAECYAAAKDILRDHRSTPLLTSSQFRSELIERDLCEKDVPSVAENTETRAKKAKKAEAIAAQLGNGGLNLPSRCLYQGCTRYTLFDLSYVDDDETSKRYREMQLGRMAPSEIEKLVFKPSS